MSNALSDLIARGESGGAGYNAYNRGTVGKHIIGADHPIDFSQLTLGQVQAMQHLPQGDPNRLLAVGKYQVIPGTLNKAVETLNLDPNQKFTPELQEQIFSDYLIADKRPSVQDYITGKSENLGAAQLAMAQEWRSFADPRTNESYVDPRHQGPNPNHASITAKECGDALSTMRTEYKADIAKGMKPEEAWAAVTNSGPNREQTQATLAHATNSASHPHHTSDVLRQGAHGPAVHDLQANLAKLGYTDHHGKPLKTDSDFGLDTKHAVERFQHDHHLKVDSIAGPTTLEAIQHAQAKNVAPNLADPKNPDHTLYAQALAGVHTIDASLGRTPDQHSDNLAASLVVAAKREGLTAINDVKLSEDGSRAFAVQGPSDSPLRHFAHVQTAEAVNTPVARSSEAAVAVQPEAAEPAITPPLTPPTPHHGHAL